MDRLVGCEDGDNISSSELLTTEISFIGSVDGSEDGKLVEEGHKVLSTSSPLSGIMTMITK
jgi:predicted aconitase with swiveling domain